MRRADRIAAIEEGLWRAAWEAREVGLVLVYGVAEVQSTDGRVIGCCVTHALDHAPTFAGRKGRPLPFSQRDIGDEFDAIEGGWDGTPFNTWQGPISVRRQTPGAPYDFYRMGVRLRKRLGSVPADSVGGGS